MREDEAHNEILACEWSYFAHAGWKPFLKFQNAEKEDDFSENGSEIAYPPDFTFSIVRHC